MVKLESPLREVGPRKESLEPAEKVPYDFIREEIYMARK